MTKTILLIVSTLLFSVSANAQIDTVATNFQKDFNQFKQSIMQEHQQFKTQNDSVFAEFLKESWKEFQVFYNKKQSGPKPTLQPVAKKEATIKEIKPKTEKTDSTRTKTDTPSEIKIKSGAQMPVKNSAGKAMLQYNFYGTETSVVNPGNLPPLQQIDAKNIETYFENTCNIDAVSELVIELRKKQHDMQLNDWGYYKLIEKTASLVEPSLLRQKLFTWAVLLKSGYNAKIGFANNEVYLMLPTNEEIYSSYYLTINNTPYYIQTGNNENNSLPKLRVHTANYPGGKTLSLHIDKIPQLGNSTINRQLLFRNDTIAVTCNKWLIDFYNEYPLCDIQLFFSAPLSKPVLKSLDNYFNPLFISATNRQKINLLLGFVQNSFAYKTDTDQFGREKYFFPDELFYYPFSDCEDKSILFSRLVKHFTGYNCIGLDFPGHVNTAVCFPGEPKGTFINFSGKNYTICDPTYTNAPIGYLDSKYENITPEIITFE
jgi:hypothetical protein